MKNNISFNHKFEIELENGTRCEVLIEVSAFYVNSGIGNYEFWGQKCCDSSYEWKLESYEILRLMNRDTEEEIFLNQEIKILVNKYFEENIFELIEKCYQFNF